VVTNEDLGVMPVRNALVSVLDYTEAIDFVRRLKRQGVGVYSTGVMAEYRTAAGTLAFNGISVNEVSRCAGCLGIIDLVIVNFGFGDDAPAGSNDVLAAIRAVMARPDVVIASKPCTYTSIERMMKLWGGTTRKYRETLRKIAGLERSSGLTG